MTVVAAAKINLALLVGPRREDGYHEVATVLQRIDLTDRLALEPAAALAVDGFPEDTLVRAALEGLAEAAGRPARFRVRLAKGIPVAAGLGGGSADAAAALVAGNAALGSPLDHGQLHELAASLGADVPFFLEPGPKLAQGIGDRLAALDLPQDFWVVVALARGARKPSTAEVYRRFDELGGGSGFEARAAELRTAVERVRRPRDLAALPPNDLAAAAGRPALVDDLLSAGAFRADVSGAGPACYALFTAEDAARAAARALGRAARTWVTVPVW